ncbi:hypothetical protein [Helicobacter pylori]|uniref:hypothetical protein n=1 Tax=Helicobacter pylori TaxID=210 RepID=UPI0015E664F5|nr:hypothetical protein [Helicobacter pylori]
MKTTKVKNKTSKTKGSVLSTSLVLKNFLKQKPNPPTQTKQTPQKKEKRNQQRENPLLERRERIRS